jgi:mannose-6-phosphate isomerase-like protein (cupin superfamily)
MWWESGRCASSKPCCPANTIRALRHRRFYRVRPQVLSITSLLFALACAGPPAVIDAGFSPRTTLPIDELVDRAPLDPGEDFRVIEIGRDAHSSQHLVKIRHAEVPHRHDRHELWVLMLEGHGNLLLGSESRAVGEGSLLYIPRGVRHAFTNESETPATAYVIYSPPFDGKDRSVDP